MTDLATFFRTLKITPKMPAAYGCTAYSSGRSAATLTSRSPIDLSKIGSISLNGSTHYERVIQDSVTTFKKWREYPAPKRGEVIRLIGEEFRKYKKELGALITLEVGKITAEGEGEIQEAIDIVDFAVGLSRQLYGLSMHSERPRHRMFEQWHPLGPVGVITAFNFPAAVWAWNAMIAAVCGDTIIWKPSQYAPMIAIAMHQIAARVAERAGFPGLFSLLIDNDGELGKKLAADKRVPLISATGSCRMGREVAQVVAKRFGKTILELGGNNGVIVLKDADLKLVLRSTLFGAVGTAGQRCTTTRRLLIEKPIFEKLKKLLVNSYAQVKIGDPRRKEVLMGPLIHESAVEHYETAIKTITAQGGKILFGGKKVTKRVPSTLYVTPTLVEATPETPIVAEETFAPILYLIPVKNLEHALTVHNAVPQGLSSAIFSNDLKSIEKFLSVQGSDCGFANVNLGTSGAEIGGAFGGEKETGGGREAGSDSWKQYMRRQTTTINFSDELPLAQGIQFG